ncbi:MAG: ribosome maturation factor RimM [Bacilli bacterium]|nr:ribosome maturation factor RimM [Bacilli bacterium]
MYYLVGRIVGTHSINGEVKVINESNFNRYFVGNTLYSLKDNKYVEIKIDKVRNHKNFILISFNGYNNINQVLDYVGLNLYTDKHEALEEGHYYFDDLIGCTVFDEDSNKIGQVLDIMENPTQDVLEVDTGKKIALIPFVEEFIKDVDIENKKIIVHLIEGLI